MPDTRLDAAWAEAESALPPDGGWKLVNLLRSGDEWIAHAEPTPGSERRRSSSASNGWSTMWLGKGARGSTPAAALVNLAAKLREPHDA